MREFRPVKTEETVSQRQNSNVKELGMPPVPIKQLVYFTNCCFNSCVEQSHKDNVRKATVEEQVCSKTIYHAVKAAHCSSTSLLLISPELLCGLHAHAAFSTTADPVGTSRTRQTCEKLTVLTAESSKV